MIHGPSKCNKSVLNWLHISSNTFPQRKCFILVALSLIIPEGSMSQRPSDRVPILVKTCHSGWCCVRNFGQKLWNGSDIISCCCAKEFPANFRLIVMSSRYHSSSQTQLAVDEDGKCLASVLCVLREMRAHSLTHSLTDAASQTISEMRPCTSTYWA